MHAILHLGTEKTGTTTIQRFMKENRLAMISQGYYFMKSTGPGNDRKLSAYCLGKGEYDEYHKNNLIDNESDKNDFENDLVSSIQKELENLPKKVHTVIFSSEHFHSRVRKDEQREKLKNLLENFFSHFTLVSYIRSQIEMAVSNYSTFLKSGGKKNLDEFLQECHPQSYYYNYFEFLSGWEKSFEGSQFIVRIFDKSLLKGSDVVSDFCDIVGLRISKLTPSPVANESVTPTGQELLKVINKNVPNFIEGVGKNQQRLAFVNAISASFPGKGENPSKEVATLIQEQFKDINNEVRSRWFPRLDSLFNIDYNKFHNEQSVDPSIVSFFHELLYGLKKIPPSQLAGVHPQQIDVLRDTAIYFEDKDLKVSLSLMELANVLRPNGERIRRKLSMYQDKVSEKLF